MKLADKWKNGPSTFLGILVHDFPNMIMLAGPQSGSASTNFPRGIETGVNWITDFLQYVWDHGYTNVEPTAEREANWSTTAAHRSMSRRSPRSPTTTTGMSYVVDPRNVTFRSAHRATPHVRSRGGGP